MAADSKVHTTAGFREIGRIGISGLLWLILLALVDAKSLENSVGKMGAPQWDWAVDGVTELRCWILPYRLGARASLEY